MSWPRSLASRRADQATKAEVDRLLAEVRESVDKLFEPFPRSRRRAPATRKVSVKTAPTHVRINVKGEARNCPHMDEPLEDGPTLTDLLARVRSIADHAYMATRITLDIAVALIRDDFGANDAL